MISIYCMIFLFHCVTNEIYRVTKKKVGHDINIMGHCTFWALPFFFPVSKLWNSLPQEWRDAWIIIINTILF